jgi:cytochrome-b5 reductase
VTFALPSPDKPLGLPTVAFVVSKALLPPVSEDYQPAGPVVRAYTPVSTNAMLGQFQLLVKVVAKGRMSNHMSTLAIGDSVEFKHTGGMVKSLYPFGGKKHITMIAGGSGITPMIQALHAILGTRGDTTKVVLLFGNKTQRDILAERLLDEWAAQSGGRLKVVHVLSQADDDPSWKGLKGHVDRDVLKDHAAPPSEDTLVMVCGPPAMHKALCGTKEDAEPSGVLAEVGYKPEQVVQF